jgi:hypothetical protein
MANYSRETILFTFHKDAPSNVNPSAADLDRWDQRLFANYDALAREACNELGMDPDDVASRSLIVGLAFVSAGSGFPVKVRNAKRFLAAVQAGAEVAGRTGEPGPTRSGLPAAEPPRTVRVAARKKKAARS